MSAFSLSDENHRILNKQNRSRIIFVYLFILPYYGINQLFFIAIV